MTDPVNHPAHYTEHPSGVECIQITEHMGFNLGNAVKYIWRADLKGSAIEDLEKARWYIDRELTKRDALFPATEPAEEETKAEEPAGTVCDETQKAYDEAVSLSYWLAKQLGEHVDDAYDRGETLTDTVQRLIEHIRPNRGKTKTTSSPVVPAPTETEWPTWQEVPEGVWFLTNQNIGCWMRRDGDKVTTVTGGWPVCTDSLAAQAPFVAAEEG